MRTNAGYMVDVEFIIQTETSEQIKEALEVLESKMVNMFFYV